ncbi:hypothetical protein ACHAPP_009225, partial [Verticillium nonalfalfae]
DGRGPHPRAAGEEAPARPDGHRGRHEEGRARGEPRPAQERQEDAHPAVQSQVWQSGPEPHGRDARHHCRAVLEP